MQLENGSSKDSKSSMRPRSPAAKRRTKTPLKNLYVGFQQNNALLRRGLIENSYIFPISFRKIHTKQVVLIFESNMCSDFTKKTLKILPYKLTGFIFQ